MQVLPALGSRIEARSAQVGVVGLGYVGLAAACTVAGAGFKVTGVEINKDRVVQINEGQNPIVGDEPGLQELLRQVVSAGALHATTSYAEVASADIILICVETPVGDHHRPGYAALRAACSSLGPVLKDGALVIVESTISPSTIDSVVRPALETASGRTEGEAYFLGHCPERVMPGKLLRNMKTMSRVCGGSSPDVAAAMVAFYTTFVDADLDAADCVTAELVKTAENAYRDVSIAFANQLALVCEIAGGDVWRVRELVNKVPGRAVLLPGAGVGGHCIPKDSWLLAAPLGEAADVSLLGVARHLNDSMPQHVAQLVRDLVGAPPTPRIAVLGYSYLENSGDVRNSPSAALVDHLRDSGCEVAVHDPLVPEYHGDIIEVLRGADCAVLMVAHSEYRALDLAAAARVMHHARMVDGRGFFAPASLEAAGFQFRVLGRGDRAESASR